MYEQMSTQRLEELESSRVELYKLIQDKDLTSVTGVMYRLAHTKWDTVLEERK